MMIKNGLIILSLVLLAACTTQQQGGNAGAGTSDAEEKNKPVPEEVEIEGLYAGKQITNCANNEIIGVSENIKTLDSAYHSLLPEAYAGQTIYVKVKGSLLHKGQQAELSVKQLVKAEQKNDRNSCVPYDYWCRGTEPFWLIQISEKENLIDFFDPMIPKYYHFIYSKPINQGAATIYSAGDKPAGNQIKISITKEKCSDGMSEREYSHKVEVILNGKTFKGCAVDFSSKNS